MEHLLSFADREYQNKHRQTRKKKFLERMETLVPWKRMILITTVKIFDGKSEQFTERMSVLMTENKIAKI